MASHIRYDPPKHLKRWTLPSHTSVQAGPSITALALDNPATIDLNAAIYARLI